MKLFHSWKRWQLIALVCVVLTAVLTLVFVLQGGGSEDLPEPTGSSELQLVTKTLADVTEPPETARSHRGAHSGPDGSHRSSDRSVYGGHKGHRIPDRRDAACHGGPDGAARNGACRSLVARLHLLHDGPGQLGQALGRPSVPSSRRTVSSSAP